MVLSGWLWLFISSKNAVSLPTQSAYQLPVDLSLSRSLWHTTVILEPVLDGAYLQVFPICCDWTQVLQTLHCYRACDKCHIEDYVMRSLKLSFVKGVRKFSLADMSIVLRMVSSRLHWYRVLSKSLRQYMEPCEKRFMFLDGYRVWRELWHLSLGKEAGSTRATENPVYLSCTSVTGPLSLQPWDRVTFPVKYLGT